MQKVRLSPGIFMHNLSPRFCTITSTLPNAAPDWRIAYFGFDKWNQAIKFVARVKRLRDVRCEARKSQRLGTPYEVKVWGLDREESRLLWCELEGHTITFAPAQNKPLLTLFLNGQRVVSILPGEQNYAMEFAATLSGLPHVEAREKIANRFLIQSNADAA